MTASVRSARSFSAVCSFYAAIVVVALASTSAPFVRANTAPLPEADRYRIVDCLLPGDVRQLGQRMVFQTPRRPVKTTVDDCQKSGGEYTLFRSGSAAAALATWLPAATGGDKEAQTNVGEMFEKGVAEKPDYAAAAQWYKRAADQGYARAQINLGSLYERGLGVPKDPIAALNLYRKAANIEGPIVLDDGSGGARRDEELARLRKELEDTRRDLERARRDLEQRRAAPEAEVARLRKQVADATAAGNSAEAARLAARVQQLDGELQQQRRQVAVLQQSEKRYLDQIRSLESETGSLREQVAAGASREQDLAQLQRELGETRRALEQARIDSEARTASAESEIRRLQQQQADAARSGRAEDARRYEQQVAQMKGELSRQQGQVKTLEQTAEGYRQRIRELEADATRLRKQVGDMEAQVASLNQTLAKSSQDLADHRKAAREDEKVILELKQELARQRQAATAGKAGDRGRVADLERSLKQREEAQATQAREIQRLEQEVRQSQAQIAKLEGERKALAAGPPRIELIDPKVATGSTRGTMQVKVRGGIRTRDVIGRVTAPAGLLSFKVNDLSEAVDGEGLFKVAVPMAKAATPVNIAAIDRQGRQAMIDLLLVLEGVPDATVATAPAADGPPIRTRLSTSDTGRYYALVIGNNNYARLPRLDTAVNDARSVAQVLRDKYGFDVTMLENGTRAQMMTAFNDMRKKVTSKDNLLIYYAGHGEFYREKQRGFWLPVDAEPDNDANWLSNNDVSETALASPAKAILIIADSCYSGTLTRSALTQLDYAMTEEERIAYLKKLARQRVRVVMTSGGVQPVLDDSGDGRHSVFARTLLDVLGQVSDVVEARRVADAVQAKVLASSLQLGMEQQPTYEPMRFAGHDGGDFLFVPVR